VNRRAFLRAVGAGSASVATVAAGGCATSDTGDVDDTTDTAVADGTPDTTDADDTAETTDANDTYRNPVFDEVFPDPSVVRGPDGTFYAYGTYHVWGDRPERRLVPILRSRTLTEWERAGEAFESRPNWKDGGVWAPSAARVCDRYLLYYSLATWGDPNPGIGVATADGPTGPFEDRGPLLRSDDVGVPNSIDPFFVRDDGTAYLLWGSKRGIHGVPLANDGLSLAGETFQVAGDGVEAPALYRRGGRYYFFGSRGTCCAGAESTYRVVVGRADSLRGPYRNRTGDSLLEASGTTILRGTDEFAGPGHADVVTDDAGDAWLVHHGYVRSKPWVGPTPRRVLFLSPLRWRDGWPTVPGDGPPRVADAPTIRPQRAARTPSTP
jgi:arabinan endo-1,5-alpha-L-arabinosidase